MSFEAQLAAAESQLHEVKTALLSAQAADLERCAALLRQTAATLAAAAAESTGTNAPPRTPAFTQRLRAIQAELSIQREQLQRLLVLAEAQAATFLPPKDASTYGNGPGPMGASRARIYRSNS